MQHNIKLIVFDSYGVCLNAGFPNTSKYLAKKYGLKWQAVQKILYDKYFNQAATKKISQKAAWKLALKELKLPINVQQIKHLHYGLMQTNLNILTLANKLKQHYQIALLSKNTREQFTEVKRRFLELKHTFGKNLINTWEYNLPKASASTIRYLCKRFRVRPEEIVYFDDQKINLKIPKSMGVHTVLYKNFPQFRQALNKYLSV